VAGPVTHPSRLLDWVGVPAKTFCPDHSAECHPVGDKSPGATMPLLVSSWVRRTTVSVFFSSALLVAGFSGFMFLASLRSQPPHREQQRRVFQVDLYRVESQPMQQIMAAGTKIQGFLGDGEDVVAE